MRISQYPTFTQIDKGVLTEISDLTTKFPPYSDFNAVSLYCWNANNNNSVSILNGNLVIKIKDYLNEGYVFSILGNLNIDDSIQTLLTTEKIEELGMVPELTTRAIKQQEKFLIEEDRDSEDYIINIQEFTSLSNKSIRKKINAFNEDNPSITVKELNAADKEHISLITNLNIDWCKRKDFDDKKMEEDIASINKFLDIALIYNSVIVGIFVNDKLAGFTFNEIISPRWAMGHFGKSSPEIKYSSLYSEYASQKILAEKGIQYINIQQDTGLPGLRETKMSYHPEYYLKKYKLKLAVR